MTLEDKSGRSNHLEAHSGSIDRCGGNEHSQSHPTDINGNWGDQHPEIIPKLSDGSGMSSMHSEIHPHVSNGNGSIDHFGTKPKDNEGSRRTNPFETIPAVADRNGRVSTSEDLAQVDTGDGSFGSHNHPSKFEEINVSNNKSAELRDLDNSTGSISASQFSQAMPPTQSPPIQVMDRSGEYDPLRLPSSVFERSKSSTPQDWSAASNESLFSIHMGNNSFSRDQFKSGELTKTEELSNFSPSTSIPEMGADKDGDVGDAITEALKDTEDVPKGTTVEKNQERALPANVLRNPSDMSNRSNESSRSFAFPVKKKKRCCTFGRTPFFYCTKKCKKKKCAWPSCYCSNYSCTLCYCSWPSCYCSNYCWNCSLKRWCCHSSTTLTDRVKSPTVRPDVEDNKQESLSNEPTIPKASSSCCWSSCFSCRPCSYPPWCYSCPPWSCSCPSFRCSSCCCYCCRK